MISFGPGGSTGVPFQGAWTALFSRREGAGRLRAAGLRMSEAPEELHVAFLERTTKPTGLGEIGNPFIGAAVANAFHRLTGKRLCHMPFTPDRVLAALKA